MKIMINQQKESMIWGLDDEQMADIDLDESLASFEYAIIKEVHKLFPDASVSVTFDDAQPSGVDTWDDEDLELVLEPVTQITERVFDAGEFWR